MKELIVIDDFLSKKDHLEIYHLTMKRKWNPVNDNPNASLSGISGYNSNDTFHELGTQIIINECLDHLSLKEIISTSYATTFYNKYDPQTVTYFHNDWEHGWTLIYFPDIEKYNYQMGGETQILIDDAIRGVLPLPNRLMAFDGSLMHKGTSFSTDKPRYSLAIQFRD